jgi:hypothetical protein
MKIYKIFLFSQVKIYSFSLYDNIMLLNSSFLEENINNPNNKVRKINKIIF